MAAECSNLLVPVCFSASYIAYASARMEPVFCVLGESAGVAAAQAIKAGAPVQNVDGAKLRSRLLERGQILEWTGPVARQAERRRRDRRMELARGMERSEARLGVDLPLHRQKQGRKDFHRGTHRVSGIQEAASGLAEARAGGTGEVIRGHRTLR